jgi:protein transport protein SEC61 subunit gamma-like protein
MIGKLRSFLAKCIRVWHILRKPTSAELKMIAKVSALGTLTIGMLGFLISLVMGVFK